MAGAPPSAEGGARPAPTAEVIPPAPRGSRLAHPAAVRGCGPAGLGLSARTFLEIIWQTQPRSRKCGVRLLLRRRARKIASCRPFCIWTRCSRCSSAASSRRWARLLLAGGKHGTCAAQHDPAQAPVPAPAPAQAQGSDEQEGREQRREEVKEGHSKPSAVEVACVWVHSSGRGTTLTAAGMRSHRLAISGATRPCSFSGTLTDNDIRDSFHHGVVVGQDAAPLLQASHRVPSGTLGQSRAISGNLGQSRVISGNLAALSRRSSTQAACAATRRGTSATSSLPSGPRSSRDLAEI